jgi:hypothetical protein
MSEIDEAELVGYACPAAISIQGQTGWLRRKWIARVSGGATVENCARLSEAITAEIADALLKGGVPANHLEQGSPKIMIAVVDATHVVVQTDFVGPEAQPRLNLGDAAMAATWGALQRVDAALGIEELEGLPRRYWRVLNWTQPKER